MTGIIPAYAGSTWSSSAYSLSSEDHPRIRGEHAILYRCSTLLPGSSPHTRGALYCSVRHRQGGGIIPAYAGSTWSTRSRAPSTRDHPRIRGEHNSPVSWLTCWPGSSPHTRGAHQHHRQRQVDVGIIPAYAGSTSESFMVTRMPQDHPRIRGEHGATQDFYVHLKGSSPHTRGAPVPSG